MEEKISRRSALKTGVLGAVALSGIYKGSHYQNSGIYQRSVPKTQIGHTEQLEKGVIPTDSEQLVSGAAGALSKLSSQIVPKTVAEGIYFTPSALMTVNIWNSVTSQAVSFECWYLDTSGNLKQVPYSGSGALLPMTGLTSSRAINSETVTLPSSGGTIISFTARITSGSATQRGQTLVKAEIDNDYNGTNGSPTTQVVVYGYAYTRKDLCYPAVDAIQDPTSGQGFLHTVTIASSVAGRFPSNTLTVPTNARWRISVALNSLVTDSNAGARTPGTTYDAVYPTNFPAGVASSTYNIYLLIGYPLPVDTTYSTFNANGFMPDQKLAASQTINWLSAGPGGAMDQWTGGFALVEEWIEPSS